MVGGAPQPASTRAKVVTVASDASSQRGRRLVQVGFVWVSVAVMEFDRCRSGLYPRQLPTSGCGVLR